MADFSGQMDGKVSVRRPLSQELGGSPHRILLLAHRPLTDPSFGGGQRTSHILEAASELGQVDTLAIHAGEAFSWSGWDEDRNAVLAYRSHGRLRAFGDRLRVRRRVGDILDAGDHDLVIARYLSTALMVPWRYWRRTILDGDDIIKRPARTDSRGISPLGRLRSSIRSVLLQMVIRQVAHVWFANASDLATLGHLAQGASLLPNAAIIHPSVPVQREPDTLMIVGHYAHPPNREAVEFLIRDVLPGLRQHKSSIKLRVIGAVPSDCAERWAATPNVEVLGFVADLGVEYARTALAVVPVNSGGGTQIKLIEALANGTPTVASRFAFNAFSEVLRERAHLFVAESDLEWVDACLHALADPDHSEEMARAASEVVGNVYGVAALRKHVHETLGPLLHAAGSQR